jgi:hypothetical protein
MIPKTCLLNNKGKLEATLKGKCNILGADPLRCKTCPYSSAWTAEYRMMDEAMQSWVKFLTSESNPIKIE